MHTQQMVVAHPDRQGAVNGALLACIDTCLDCAQACVSCADACLAEKAVAGLTQCIRLNLDCADICKAMANLATRRTGHNEAIVKRLLDACVEACRACGEECRKHSGQHDHCAICAEACALCEQACRKASDSLAEAVH